MSKTIPMMAWHYTTSTNLEGIQRDGWIRPATSGVPASERPVTWFSVHLRFEPTAAKGLIDSTGLRRNATIAEMIQFCGGLARLGVPARELLTGEALRRKARISNPQWRGLCSAAAIAGANPAHWFGIVGPVELGRCTVQRWNASTDTWEAFVPPTAHGEQHPPHLSAA